MKSIDFREIEGRSLGYYALLAFFGVLVLAGLFAGYYMYTKGHRVTGMNNQIVWGIPHVFAVFMIVSASGALNVASIASVFGRAMYKPLARLSGLLAISLLIGGLTVLVLDLGKPDRLIVAMTTYNFKSIFAWNIFLYTGFIVVVAVYLWTMMERRMNKHTKSAGMFAFIWRLTLTTGTGSIFGFLIAREAYDSALLAPMFIIMSFSFGLAIFILYTMSVYALTGRPLGDAILRRLKNLLGVFVAAVLYFVAVYHLTNLYMTAHHAFEKFILLDGGVYTGLFWIGQVLIGSIIPLVILFHPRVDGSSRRMIALAAALVLVGAFCQIYVIIIGGEAFPLIIFPGKIVSSSFFDGAIGHYRPSLPEITLGLAGVALALGLPTFAIKVLPYLPASLADADVDPHHESAVKATEAAHA
ncbi:MAG: polysulfide reductase NrfD [Gammaproteobacteria bacterium]|nr:polysulfide reductase NrfD [Gammaproteobacteria bacterium]